MTADIESRIASLKLLAALSPKPLDRLRCLEELLRVRGRQLQAQMRDRPADSAAH
jgi:hypothetical protein